MTRRLLIRGMIAGIIAGLLAFVFARIFGEPQVQLAINFETAMDVAAGHAPDPELVSRALQRSAGLLTAAILFGAGYGGLFSLVFAVAYGRVGRFGPRALAALLALAGFVCVVLVPDLKYPANPPSVGEPVTIGLRTAVFFEIIALSLAAMTLAVLAARRLQDRLGNWNACLAGAALYIAIMGIAFEVLPAINEVPSNFPATVLWKFRVAALGMQVMVWGTFGLVFGPLAEKLLMPRSLMVPAGRVTWRPPA